MRIAFLKWLPVGRNVCNPQCQEGVRHKALPLILFLFNLLAFVAVSPAVAELAGDSLPAEVSYNSQIKNYSVYFSTSAEACAYGVSSYKNPLYSDAVGIETPPELVGDCSYTVTWAGYPPQPNQRFQNWFGTQISCPTGYTQVGKTCSQKNPITSPKYPPPSACNTTGNPIYTAYGNKFQREIDYTGTGGSLLTLERVYNSAPAGNQHRLQYSPDNSLGSFGANWLHTYSRALKYVTNGTLTALYAYRPDGRLLFFKPSTNGWVSGADINDTVKVKELTDHWQYTNNATEEVEEYDAKGTLVSITTRTGQMQTLNYSAATPSTPGQLMRVTDQFGRHLDFTYDSLGRISTMADPAGNITGYGYDATGNLSTVTYPDDTPDTTDNPVRTYLYNEPGYTSGKYLPHALTGIKDDDKRYATFTYDTTGKAIATEHADGVDKYQLKYVIDSTTGIPTTVTVTDPLDATYTTKFDIILGAFRSIGQDQPAGPGAGCPAAGNNISYDANGNIASHTDFNGNKTCYAYGLTRNLETVRVEGLAKTAKCSDVLPNNSTITPPARKITTEWNTFWRVPKTIAEPNRLTTQVWGNTCGSKGVLCSKTLQATSDSTGANGIAAQPVGNTRSWNYSYNNRAQLETLDGPRNNTTAVTDQTTYDYYPDDAAVASNSKLLNTVTDGEGHVTTYNSYDANGNPTKITAANGVVSNLDYNARNRLKTFTVAGRTTYLDYYPNGLLSKVTSPAAGTITYGYDDAQRLTSITNAANEKVVYTLDKQGNRTK
ncbi:MAG: DUF6531 domain-containing protein [Methylococcaceae bacterium]